MAMGWKALTRGGCAQMPDGEGVMNDVPRDSNGWPTVGPNFFTLEQLIAEAESWRSGANNGPGTMGSDKWKLYTGEIVSRGFLDEVDVRAWVRRGPPTITRKEGKWVVEFSTTDKPL